MNVVSQLNNPAPHRPDNDEIGDTLNKIGQRLAAPRQTIEKAFLEMGQGLIGCTRLLGEISAAHKGIPDELDGEAFNDVARILASIRDEVLHLSSARLEEGENLAGLTEIARAAATPIHSLRNSVRAIRLVAVNARIEAALVVGSEGELNVFTQDMRELAQSIDRVVDMFAQAHGSFSQALANARAASAAFTERHGTTMSEISARLAEHLNYIATYRQSATTTARENTTLGAQIRSRVGQAVSALQIGDITRQRVEHVEEALNMLRERAVETNSDTPGQENRLAATSDLLGAQLEELQKDFECQITDLAKSLEELSNDAASALEAGNSAVSSAFSDGEAALASIIDDIAEIRALFQDFSATRASMEKVVGSVADSVRVMVDRLGAIADLEHRIRLLSLNTAIQCGRLGIQGRALRVIAQNMREIARETVAASSAILVAMDKADGLSQRLVDGETADLASRTALLDDNAGRAIDLLGKVSGRLRGHVSTMARMGPRAVDRLRAAAEHAMSQRALGACFMAIRTDIQALSPSDADLSAVDHEFFAALRRRYTMDSERKIHDRIFGLPPSVEKAPASTSDDDDLSDIFF